MTTTLDQIKRSIRTNLPLLREKYHVGKIGVFGSMARGDNTDQSDVDILVDLSKPVGLFEFVALENYLADILGKKVDLTTPNALKPIIRSDILHEVVYV